MEENLQIPSSLELLQESIKTQRESESQTSQSKWGRRRRADNMWTPNENVPRTSTSAGDELWNFLRPHVAPILAGKGHNDNMRRSTRIHFEIPPLGQFFTSCDTMFRYILFEQVPEQMA